MRSRWNLHPKRQVADHEVAGSRPVTIQSPVVSLRLAGNPAAVLRTITFVDVEPLQRQAVGRMSHIGEEILKPVPAFAHGNTATPISAPHGVFRVVTTLKHVAPDPMDLRSPTPRSHSMGRTALFQNRKKPS